MRFKGLDLNLLLALQVLLEEKSVSAAAQRLNISQPGMSASLKRLREYFNDDLLQANGKTMVPTAHALHIEPTLRSILTDLDNFVSETTHFDPQSSKRTFVVTASDYIASVFIAPLMSKLATCAPHIKLKILPPADSTAASLLQGAIDLAILPVSLDLPGKFLLEERFVAVGCANNPVFDQGLSDEDFYNAGHVVVRIGRLNPTSVAENTLKGRNISRREYMQVSSFLAAPEMVINTNLLTTMHERLARKFAAFLPIKIAEMPFDLPKMREYVYFNPARENDLGMLWLLGMIEGQICINDSNTYP